MSAGPEILPMQTRVAARGFPADFYGFPDVPYHIHLGMRFQRPNPEGPAVVTLPAQAHLLGGDGCHAAAALYTVGEVAAGISTCDALLSEAGALGGALVPLVLTSHARFTPVGRARGDIRSQTAFAGDVASATEQLRSRRKAHVRAGGPLLEEHGEVVARILVDFYVRLMKLSSLQAMAGALVPAIAVRAGAALQSTPGAGGEPSPAACVEAQ